ncbi:MAG: iron ABC transporter permease [Caulobacterales bacterium]
MRAAQLYAIGLALLFALFCASMMAGRVWLPPADIAHALFSKTDDLATLVVREARLPRAILAILVGAALGLSGAVMQGLLRNPLADPGLLGISSGAALGAVVAIYYGIAQISALATPLFGLGGAFAAGALVFTLARGGGTLTLILAGAAISSLTGAGLALALNFAPSPFAAYEITSWLLGSLTDRSWDHVLLAAPFIFGGCALLLTTGRAVDALSLGEIQAESLGIDVARTRIIAIIGTACAVGAATAITGTIGFIGLVAPHLVRPFTKYQPSKTLALSAILGAILLLAADIATRVLRTDAELKLGVFTALIGAPFFFWLVLYLRKRTP